MKRSEIWLINLDPATGAEILIRKIGDVERAQMLEIEMALAKVFGIK